MCIYIFFLVCFTYTPIYTHIHIEVDKLTVFFIAIHTYCLFYKETEKWQHKNDIVNYSWFSENNAEGIGMPSGVYLFILC